MSIIFAKKYTVQLIFIQFVNICRKSEKIFCHIAIIDFLSFFQIYKKIVFLYQYYFFQHKIA